MNKIKLNNNPLDLKHTLTCGQAFRWKEINNKWFGYISNLPILIHKDNDYLFWEGNQTKKEIIKYFMLDTNLNKIYSELINSDKDIEPLIEKYYGLRNLKQDVEETFYSFMCSAANSIPKIIIGIEKITNLFEENKIIFNNQITYKFPNTSQLANTNIENLQNIKEIAFRGKNIYISANIINSIPNYFSNLEKLNYKEAKESLTNIKNIGPKIADCICLFSLNMPFVVPVDTHVKQIAEKKFNYKMNGKTITKTVYNDIQQIFIDKYGNNAGLAQQLLFFNEI